ncbi:MAG: hypothetical protein Q8P20_08985 [bacterium]|nr:hypothetical protein [bacterium]
MDDSKEYILQCEKAVEIQKMVGDWDYGYDVETCKVGVRVAHEWREEIRADYGVPELDDDFYSSWIWLPRQDQLQEMLGDYEKQLYILDDWREGGYDDIKYWNIGNLKTWEQLWLAFVMKEKYNKVWDGTDWIKG